MLDYNFYLLVLLFMMRKRKVLLVQKVDEYISNYFFIIKYVLVYLISASNNIIS